MARGLIGAAIQGAAAVAVPALTQQHITNQKSEILAKRDARLQSFQTGEREAGQTFRTEERVAGETFKAGEAVKERESEVKLARIKGVGGMSADKRFKIVGGQVFDVVVQEFIEVPEDIDGRLKIASTMAIAQKEIDVERFKHPNKEVKASKSYKDFLKKTDPSYLDEAMKILRSYDRKKTKAGATTDPAKPKGKAVITDHTTYGDIFEEDIEETMRTNNLTREQVLQRLGS